MYATWRQGNVVRDADVSRRGAQVGLLSRASATNGAAV